MPQAATIATPSLWVRRHSRPYGRAIPVDLESFCTSDWYPCLPPSFGESEPSHSVHSLTVPGSARAFALHSEVRVALSYLSFVGREFGCCAPSKAVANGAS